MGPVVRLSSVSFGLSSGSSCQHPFSAARVDFLVDLVGQQQVCVLPTPVILPSSSTTIWSASRTELIRCAMMNTVVSARLR